MEHRNHQSIDTGGIDAWNTALEKRVDDGLSSLRTEMHAELRAVHTRIDALDKRVGQAA